MGQRNRSHGQSSLRPGTLRVISGDHLRAMVRGATDLLRHGAGRLDWGSEAYHRRILSDEGFGAGVEFVEDRSLSGLDQTALVQSIPLAYPSDYRHPVVFVVDSVTIAAPEHPILVIDLSEDEAEEPFRSTPSQIQAIENNLSLANMDFFEFAGDVDSDGVYRGSQ